MDGAKLDGVPPAGDTKCGVREVAGDDALNTIGIFDALCDVWIKRRPRAIR